MSTSPKYEFKYEGAVTTRDEALASLKHSGPLLIAADHLFARMLPDALPFDPVGGVEKVITETEMQGSAIGGMLLHPAVNKGGTHFAVWKDRWASMVQDLDDDGFDWTPIPGDAETAWPVANRRIEEGVAKLPDAKRMLLDTEVFYDGPADDPGTTLFYDALTCAMLTRGEGGMRRLAQYMALTPGKFRLVADG